MQSFFTLLQFTRSSTTIKTYNVHVVFLYVIICGSILSFLRKTINYILEVVDWDWRFACFDEHRCKPICFWQQLDYFRYRASKKKSLLVPLCCTIKCVIFRPPVYILNIPLEKCMCVCMPASISPLFTWVPIHCRCNRGCS